MFKIIIILLFSAKAFCQPVANNPVGPLSDVPSLVLSGVTAALYLPLKTREETTARRAGDFSKMYAKRLRYYGGILWLSTVKEIINDVKDRSARLRHDNEKLSFLFYSAKKQNRIFLGSADRQIENMSSHFLNGELTAITGEKFNLYEDLRTSLSGINRQLDEVEDNIKYSNLKSTVIKQFVK